MTQQGRDDHRRPSGDPASASSRAPVETRVIGQSIPDVSFRAKVQGLERFSIDQWCPGMLHARTLRSLYPHARIRGINVSRAAALEGVVAVLTAADVSGTNRFGTVIPDQRVLVPVGDTAKMVGDPLALVAAESEAIAERAVGLIEVDYEPLPVVGDPDEALAPDAPVIHPEFPNNLCGEEALIQRGNLEQGFAAADVVLEEYYTTPRQEHAYMEPEAGLAVPEPDGSITVYAGTQAPMQTRLYTAVAVGLPEHKLRIVPPALGGGFGGKTDPLIQPSLALLALKTRRPVRLAWKSEESFLVSTKRNPSRTRMKIGARADGRLTALQADILLDGGAYASTSIPVLQMALAYLNGPYDFPVVALRGRVAYTNNPISGAFRGFGGPQGCFPIETMLNRLAGRLGVDPVALRLMNAMREGDTPANPIVRMDQPVSLGAVFERALERAGEKPAPRTPLGKVGRGLACAMPLYDVSGGLLRFLKDTTVEMEMLPDATVVVRSEAVDFGEGTRTLLAQIAAEELHVPFEDVSCISGDTAVSPKSGRGVASRQAYCVGNATVAAAREIKRRLVETAADRLEAPTEAIELADRRVVVAESPERGIELSALALYCREQGVDLAAKGTFTIDLPVQGHTYSAAIVDVEVDEATGKLWVLKSVSVVDVGKALNPISALGQIHGAAAQGLGFGLLEDMQTEDGVLLTPSLMQYLLPTAMDVPAEDIADYIEVPSTGGPYGAKGMAEHAIKDITPALAAAVHDAVGVWIHHPPVTPEKIWRALADRS